jgi:hypothetical protein
MTFTIILGIALVITLICLFTPDIVFMIHKEHFIMKNVSQWGYSTPKQYRYAVGDEVILSDPHNGPEPMYNNYVYKGTTWTVLETGRHDYLLQNEDGINIIVKQYEISLK